MQLGLLLKSRMQNKSGMSAKAVRTELSGLSLAVYLKFGVRRVLCCLHGDASHWSFFGGNWTRSRGRMQWRGYAIVCAITLLKLEMKGCDRPGYAASP